MRACFVLADGGADVLLIEGLSDAKAPAVQRGVGDGGGIDPAALRAELAAVMPNHHVVLTWARSGMTLVFFFFIYGGTRDPFSPYAVPRFPHMSGMNSSL